MREIIINERQEQLLMNTILQESVYNQDYNAKILRIKDILDKDGEFYKMLKQLDIETSNQGILVCHS